MTAPRLAAGQGWAGLLVLLVLLVLLHQASA
jgi:hypothetical protein